MALSAKDQRFMNSFYRLAARVLTHDQRMHNDAAYRERFNAECAAELAERARFKAERDAREKQLRANDAEYFTSDEFREEVITEIIGSGATRLQAEGRTRDQARLFNEARELGLM